MSAADADSDQHPTNDHHPRPIATKKVAYIHPLTPSPLTQGQQSHLPHPPTHHDGAYISSLPGRIDLQKKISYAIEIISHQRSLTSSRGRYDFRAIGQLSLVPSTPFEAVLDEFSSISGLKASKCQIVYRKKIRGQRHTRSISSRMDHEAFVHQAINSDPQHPIVVRLHQQDDGTRPASSRVSSHSSTQKQRQRKKQVAFVEDHNSSKCGASTPVSMPPKTSSSTQPQVIVVLMRVLQVEDILRSLGLAGKQTHSHQQYHIPVVEPQAQLLEGISDAPPPDKIVRMTIKTNQSLETLRGRLTGELRSLLHFPRIRLIDFRVTYGMNDPDGKGFSWTAIETERAYRNFIERLLKNSKWDRPFLEVQLAWRDAGMPPSSLVGKRDGIPLSERRQSHRSTAEVRSRRFEESPIRSAAGAAPSLPSLKQTPTLTYGTNSARYPLTPELTYSQMFTATKDPRRLALKRRADDSVEQDDCESQREILGADSSRKCLKRDDRMTPAANVGGQRCETPVARAPASASSPTTERALSMEGSSIMDQPEGPYMTISAFMKAHRPGYEGLVEALHQRGIRDMPHLAACESAGVLQSDEQDMKSENTFTQIDVACIGAWVGFWRRLK